MFLNDLDFFNKKLICIVSHIDNSIQYYNIYVIWFIHESDISKFYIININIKKLTTIFRCTFDLNEKLYDENVDDITLVNTAKIAIHKKKMTQLLNLFILMDEGSCI